MPQVPQHTSTADHFPRNSVSISPFDQPIEVSSGMQDLPAAFTPLQGGLGFHTPHYSDLSQWNHAGGQTSQMPTQAHSIYTGSIGGSWISPHGIYQDGGMPQYHVMDPPQDNYTSHTPVAEAGLYTTMNGQSPHISTLSYQNTPHFGEQQAQFSTPQFGSNMSHSLPTSQANHAGLPMQYDPKTGLPYTQPSLNTPAYQGQQHHFYGDY